jgi:hypothetical protein
LENVACHISDLQKGCDVLFPLLLLKHCVNLEFFFLAFFLVEEDIVHVQLLHPLTTIHADDCEEQLQQISQGDPLNYWISSSEFSGYGADFHERHSTVGAWQGHSTSAK